MQNSQNKQKHSQNKPKRIFISILCGALGGYLVSVFFGALLGGFLWFWLAAKARQKNATTAEKKRNQALKKELPDLITLFSIALSAGLTVRLALEAVVNEIPELTLRESKKALSEALNSVRLGMPIMEALQAVPPALAPLSVPLADSERYGSGLLPALYIAGRQVREQNKQISEAKVRKIPIKLLFPLVICFLPAFCVLTLAPVFIRSLQVVSL